MSGFYNDSVFWVEVDKIEANPFQPRKEFNADELRSLSDSIRQYGVLQALVVTRREEEKEEGGIQVKYELISGERRLRAARLAGVREVPVLIRTGDESSAMKLELAIIENIQREDLNVVDRARAFKKLADEFNLKHIDIAKKVGKSREYVSNTMRVLVLPEEILEALSSGKLSEGHARPLGMLSDRPEEQITLFKEVVFKKMSVRESERIARRIAYDKVRKINRAIDPSLVELEEKLSESFGTRVQVERKNKGGRISIDFFSDRDLESIMQIAQSAERRDPNEMLYKQMEEERNSQAENVNVSEDFGEEKEEDTKNLNQPSEESEDVNESEESHGVVDETKNDSDEDEDMYSIRNFSV